MDTKPFFLTLLILLAIVACSCKESDTVVIPDMNVPETLSNPEGSAQQIKAIIPVSLSEVTTEQVSLTWSTSDGTAKAGEDYVAVNGTALVFNPGEITKNIEVLIVNDSTYEPDETLFVTLSNVKNAKITGYRTQLTIVNDDVLNPSIQLASLTKVLEGTATQYIAKIPVTLTPASDKTVTLKWSTKEGSAKIGDDYVSVTGSTLVFAPGETLKNIEVPLVNDAVLEFNDAFTIVVDEVTNAAYSEKESKVIIMNDDSYTAELASDGYITPESYQGMQKVWGDEFDAPYLNMEWWTYELGGGGWGNNELQTYTNAPANSFISNGKLNIVAVHNYGSYTSARLVTKGKKEFTYGRIDIRAKMPYGQGIWPALWTLGANINQVSWPSCGELDIMEYLGQDPARVYGTAHYNASGHQYKGGSYILSNNQGFDDQFHVFTIIWQENSVIWYVDYHQYFEATDASIKFDAFKLPQFFIFNVAIGGNWPGNPDATTVFPQTMTVDYIRVFQPL
jgi:beta-glucanase (GH16 family)